MAPGPDSNGERRAPDAATSDAVFAAAVELVTSSSASFERTARRFSLCSHDAEDAYQRGLEILLTKAPTARREELRPWLHTVIKHEALALRRQRERSVCAQDDAAGAEAVAAAGRAPEEAATDRERVQRTAEALAALKPGEMQCLMLKALGYSYDEISARTGFSWTKVNRSLTEGRRRFFERFGDIASGAACREYQPLLSAACDGHAGEEDERILRAHLAACAGCRATLRAYRSAPARLAELLPPAIVLPLLDRTSTLSRISDWFAVTAGERATAIGVKLHHGAEVVSAQKAAAVVASTAAIAGGGAAVQHADRPDAGPPARAERAASSPRPVPSAAEPGRAALSALAATSPGPGGGPPPVRERRRPRPAVAEFGFEGGGGSSATARRGPVEPVGAEPVASASAAGSRQAEFAPEGGSAGSGGGAGEFAP
jgi:RNA polymerase sigma factor (sigma-70 family)